MSERVCFKCQNEIPAGTEHFIIEDEGYCTDCVDARPYEAYTYYIDGEYMGCSEDAHVSHVEGCDDEWEG